MMGSSFGIRVSVPDKVIVGKREKDVEVCFTPVRREPFYGIIVFESFNKQAIAGSFIIDSSGEPQ